MLKGEFYSEDQTFEKIDFSTIEFPVGQYDNAEFLQCNFAGVNLSNAVFIDCRFYGCNFSLNALTKTSFQTVRFEDCKLLGLHFEDCNPFLLDVHFKGCTMHHSSFIRLVLKNTVFDKCRLKATDFSMADLSSSGFLCCDLEDVVFNQTNLEKADLSTSYHFRIDPEINKLRKAKFSTATISGLLFKYGIDIID